MSEGKRTIIQPHAGFQEKFVCSDVDFVIGGGAMASGKEQPLDSLVLTPDGWRKMGDIKVGDEVMTPFDGPSKVLMVLPQGVKDVYRLTTSDGRSCECGLDHLWQVNADGQEVTVTTAGIMALMRQKCSVLLPMPDIDSFPENLAQECREFFTENAVDMSATHVGILSVEKVRRAECQCIAIDSDRHLYVTDDYIVTHNTYGALLMAAQHVSDPNFRMVFIRRNVGDLKVGGGGADEAQKLYGSIASIKMSDSPRLSFPSGAFIDFTHMADQDPDTVLERVKGWQYSCIYVDEATSQEWSTIRILMSRNRSQAQWSGKFRCTCNPKRSSWLRHWVDWFVDDDGYPIPERDGVVRYFFVAGEDITDVVFGASKKEVYEHCRHKIDPLLQRINRDSDRIYTYGDIVKSYTFYGGNVAENKSLMRDNAGYIGSVASMGDRQAQANLLGCWNVDDNDDTTPILGSKAREVADNEPQVNGDKWITADLADTGTDNCIILVWDGLHIIDHHIITQSTPARNCAAIRHIAAQHSIGDAHVIYDAQRAAYMIDEFPGAIPFISFKPAVGIYKRVGERIKDICYLRLAECVNNNRISMADKVANARYTHQRRKHATTLADEFVRECAVVNFDTTPSGKYKLWSKKAMNRMLGGQFSMDLLDAVSMRMYPLAQYEYGSELETSRTRAFKDAAKIEGSIYDNTIWF